MKTGDEAGVAVADATVGLAVGDPLGDVDRKGEPVGLGTATGERPGSDAPAHPVIASAATESKRPHRRSWSFAAILRLSAARRVGPGRSARQRGPEGSREARQRSDTMVCMRRILGRVVLGMLALVLLAAVALGVFNELTARDIDRPLDAAELTAEDLTAITEAQRLQHSVGGELLPGFDDVPIGFVVFNDAYEFLVTPSAAIPAGWEPVADAEPLYLRREAVEQQAFAIPVGDGWAASLPTRQRMNRDFFLGAREGLPFPFAQLLPAGLASIAVDQYPMGLMHEATHAFAAITAPNRFAQADDAYALEPSYPLDEDAFADAWAAEGAALHAAMTADDLGAAREAAGRFLDLRAERRRAASLSPALIGFEQDLEWLEGIAKYVEIRAYHLAAAEPGSEDRGYWTDAPYWDQEIARLADGIEDTDGDYRFYLSGMGIASVLDRLNPDWKTDQPLEELVLEEALASALDG